MLAQGLEAGAHVDAAHPVALRPGGELHALLTGGVHCRVISSPALDRGNATVHVVLNGGFFATARLAERGVTRPAGRLER
jgi:hypothetical protein